jgi:hypothetical protein
LSAFDVSFLGLDRPDLECIDISCLDAPFVVAFLDVPLGIKYVRAYCE